MCMLIGLLVCLVAKLLVVFEAVGDVPKGTIGLLGYIPVIHNCTFRCPVKF